MKRIAFFAALIALAAYAAPDADPWVRIQEQREYTKPVQFDREVYFSSIDAGVSRFSSVISGTVKTDLLDAGAGTINGLLRVGGAIIGSAEIGTTAGLDAGYGLINGQFRVLGPTIVTSIAGTGEIGTTAGIDAGYGMINGQLQVLGPALTGVKSKVGTVTTATAASQDGGVQTPLIQFGYGAGSSGVLAVTFTKAFTSNPQCQCTHVGTTNTNGCVLTTGSVPTTTTASFTVGSGGSDIIHWLCVGDQ